MTRTYHRVIPPILYLEKDAAGETIGYGSEITSLMTSRRWAVQTS